MQVIHKKIVTDEQMHPIAVQIDYTDWLEIERFLTFTEKKKKIVDLSDYFGTISLEEDPLLFQKRIRDEW